MSNYLPQPPYHIKQRNTVLYSTLLHCTVILIYTSLLGCEWESSLLGGCIIKPAPGRSHTQPGYGQPAFIKLLTNKKHACQLTSQAFFNTSTKSMIQNIAQKGKKTVMVKDQKRQGFLQTDQKTPLVPFPAGR